MRNNLPEGAQGGVGRGVQREKAAEVIDNSLPPSLCVCVLVGAKVFIIVA